ncbi:MAG: hypothetical protein KY460_03035 [Actinobacteria bacterium]|nr:hypothetical protein [Actinomycetota bacterium]
MVSTHQRLFARLPSQASAVLVETPYGFQENADEISQRTVDYFTRNVGRSITPIGLPTVGGDGDDDAAMARLHAADLVFTGPGSPTYALAQWRGSAFADIVAGKLRTGGIVVFASAAAVGLGRCAVPVYEIYKVGQAPHWVDGLDLLGVAGIDAAVIPHFDNTEGGTHDTRFCYLGVRRLQRMERELDPGTSIIGVDEHTALVLDLAAATVAVHGRGDVTVRRAGATVRTVPAGTELSIRDLTRGADSRSGAPPAPSTAHADDTDTPTAELTLGEQVEAATAAFDAATARRDAAAATAAVLELEAAIAGWTADTTQSGEADRARATLRALVVRLGEAAGAGLVDPAARIAPLIDVVVRARSELRGRRDYALADRLRAAAEEIGVEVRDTADGTTWQVVNG